MYVRIYICKYIVTALHSHAYGVILDMVQPTSKFTARISQHVYLARFFARHKELHVFDV